MIGALTTCALRLEPRYVRITVDGRARVRAQGYGYGFLRCGGVRRWVWGAFDESFLLNRRGDWVVTLSGLTGSARAVVSVEVAVDLRPRAEPAWQARALRFEPYGAPRVRPLQANEIYGRTSLRDASREGEP